MADRLVAPFITLDKNAGVDYLAAHFTWYECIESAFRHRVVENRVLRDTDLTDFTFFDGRGFQITVVPGDPTRSHRVDNVDHSVQVRAQVGSILAAVASVAPALEPSQEVRDLPGDQSLAFPHFGLLLAAALRDGPPTVDPHRRGWWHNLCHRVFRRR